MTDIAVTQVENDTDYAAMQEQLNSIRETMDRVLAISIVNTVRLASDTDTAIEQVFNLIHRNPIQ